ncbi:MAG: MFS transporter [Promethearchaeota archaeon]
MKGNYVREFGALNLLAFLRTLSMGITGTAVTNLLLLEMGYPAAVAGVVAGLSSLGFVAFIAAFGNLADRTGRRGALRAITGASLLVSFTRFIPLTSLANLVAFSAFHLVDGGLSGLFWPVQQSYAVVAEAQDPPRGNSYIAGYNLGWNSGLIAGYFLGAVLVDALGTNYACFYANLVAVALSFALSMAAVPGFRHDPPAAGVGGTGGDTREGTRDGDPEGARGGALDGAQGWVRGGIRAGTRAEPKKGAREGGDASAPSAIFPVYLVLAAMLVHSFADGALAIVGPLKVSRLGGSSAEVFLLATCKAVAQTTTSTLGAHLPDRSNSAFLVACPGLIAAAWWGFGAAATLPGVLLSVALSGTFQGLLYANGMKALTKIAGEEAGGKSKVAGTGGAGMYRGNGGGEDAGGKRSNRHFAYFQFTMGFGRMSGPVVMGVLAGVSPNAGVYVVCAFGVAMAGAGLLRVATPRHPAPLEG